MEQRQNRGGVILGLVAAAVVAAVIYYVPPPPSAASSSAPEQTRTVRKERFAISGRSGCKASARFTNTGTIPIELGEVHLLITSRGQFVDDDHSLFDIYPLQPGQSTTWETLFSCPPRSGRIQYEISIVDQGRPVTITEARR